MCELSDQQQEKGATLSPQAQAKDNLQLALCLGSGSTLLWTRGICFPNEMHRSRQTQCWVGDPSVCWTQAPRGTEKFWAVSTVNSIFQHPWALRQGRNLIIKHKCCQSGLEDASAGAGRGHETYWYKYFLPTSSYHLKIPFQWAKSILKLKGQERNRLEAWLCGTKDAPTGLSLYSAWQGWRWEAHYSSSAWLMPKCAGVSSTPVESFQCWWRVRSLR